jgi:hypothetical protein
VFGDGNKFETMRYMIVHRLRSFPEKYFVDTINFETYCNNMLIHKKPASPKELQAAADIFFAVIECYFIEDPITPANIFYPLRCDKIHSKHANCLRLWTQGIHCMALVDSESPQPLIKNIFEDSANVIS